MNKIQREDVGPGEESVWDYPRPPRLERTGKHIEVIFNGTRIADTQRAVRVLETSHPPVYYIPAEDVKMEYLKPTQRASVCEWKGGANYYTIHVGNKIEHDAAWTYHKPLPGFQAIKDHIAFYPARMDSCLVNGEKAQPQPGGFYGGWITKEIKGPFKGSPGTSGW